MREKAQVWYCWTFLMQFPFKPLISCGVAIVHFFPKLQNNAAVGNTEVNHIHAVILHEFKCEKKQNKNIWTTRAHLLKPLSRGERGSQPPQLPADAFPSKSSEYAAGTALLIRLSSVYWSTRASCLPASDVKVCTKEKAASVLGAEVLLCTCAPTKLPLAPWMELMEPFKCNVDCKWGIFCWVTLTCVTRAVLRAKPRCVKAAVVTIKINHNSYLNADNWRLLKC